MDGFVLDVLSAVGHMLWSTLLVLYVLSLHFLHAGHILFSPSLVKLSMSRFRHASQAGEGGQALTRQLILYWYEVIRPRIPMSLPPNLTILIYWFYSCVCFTKVSESSAWPHMAIRGGPWAYHRRFIIVACAFTCPVGLSNSQSSTHLPCGLV